MRSRGLGFRVLILTFCGLTGLVGCETLPLSMALDYDDSASEPACLDLWSIVHVASGYLIGRGLGEDSAAPTTGLLLAYEVAEPRFWPGFNESSLNQQCDIAVGALAALAELRTGG
ncbi:MAG: hypothetical protein ACYSVY_02965 [Planctomycetota bacterium]|jgi:hypothetical protein